MFDNRKIKHLRRLPDGNNIVLIWVMLLTMAGRCNSGGMIFLTENIPYTPKMLADELDFEENTVQLALGALEQLNMIVTNNGFFSIAGWEEYQNIEGMDKIRAQNRLRKQKQREKQALLDVSRDVTGQVTQCHATDIEEDKEKDKDKELYSSIIAYLNEKAGTNYRASSKATQTCIHARLAEGFTEADFKTVIDKKCAEWIGGELEQYLRPSTLFGTKFESYLNAKVTKPNQAKPVASNVYNSTDQNDLDDLF
jgi:uncharacterized phage protein (TIGR02220 family)/predicted phage replisome organizer